MDSNICLWDASGVRYQTFTEHTGSISKIVADKKSGVYLSCSYDSSIRVWNESASSSLLVYLEFIKNHYIIIFFSFTSHFSLFFFRNMISFSFFII